MSTLDDIKARAEKATEGPWTYMGKDHETTWIESPVEDVLIHDERGTGHMREDFSWIKQPDAEFIAHARTDIPKLVAALEAVEALHQPFEWSFGFGPVKSCKHCKDQGADEIQSSYPCATVQAITKALK